MIISGTKGISSSSHWKYQVPTSLRRDANQFVLLYTMRHRTESSTDVTAALAISRRRAIEGIAVHNVDIGQPQFLSKPAGGGEVFFLVVAQRRGDRQMTDPVNRFQDVAPRTRGDV